MKPEEIAVGVIFFLIYYRLKRLFNYRKNRLFDKGISVKAEVIRLDDTGFTIDSGVHYRVVKDLILLIKETPYENKRLFIRQSFDSNSVPHLGETVTILVDPNSPGNGLIISH